VGRKKGGEFMCWWWFGRWNFFSHWNWFGAVIMIVWSIVVIVAAAMFFRWFFSSFGANAMEKSNRALEILKERLAKGEITEEEYERLKKTLV
jgi:putative membrane protein